MGIGWGALPQPAFLEVKRRVNATQREEGRSGVGMEQKKAPLGRFLEGGKNVISDGGCGKSEMNIARVPPTHFSFFFKKRRIRLSFRGFRP